MANPTGFKQFTRLEGPHRPISERIKDWYEVDQLLVEKTLNEQAARCMDCGIPFCHGAGCPVKNRIPEFNDLVYRGQWRAAADNLHSTNNFPEMTGRICPAPCETACTLAINDRAVNIKHIELQIAERAFKEGWVEPILPPTRTGKRVAVIGSGPAGLAAAQQVNRCGHETVVFEKDDRIGGLLRYGIPDFKLEKRVIDRRLEQMSREGVRVQSGVEVGRDMTASELRSQFDAVCLCMGAGHARPLNVPGAELRGVHLAMEFLTQQNRRGAGDDQPACGGPVITAKGKHVIVVGGGDTGSDCVGTSIRQGAISVTQLEILPKPPDDNNDETPWPIWPKIMRTSSSQEEGCERRWSVLTKELRGDDGQVRELYGVEINWLPGPSGWDWKEIPGTEFILPADLVLIAMGFLHKKGNVVVDTWMTTVPGVFASGDTVRGASLVVHAINQGRIMAAAVDKWLRA
jgi:glutamate synthase (NADPH/NADH) small chain